MQCKQAHEALSALVDGEHVTGREQEAAAHIAGCPLCSERAQEYRDIGEQLRTVGRVPLPPNLGTRIREQLNAEAWPEDDTQRFDWRQFARQAAVLTVVAGLSSLVSWYLTETATQKRSLERDIVAAHARSLLQDSTVQVASSESHTVKPWFNGRIEFAPTVRDFAQQGFPLIGGRLDLVGGQRTATLVYKRRLHIINVFIWPAVSIEQDALKQTTLQGYNIVSWMEGGMRYAAVSDLNAKELAQFQALL